MRNIFKNIQIGAGFYLNGNWCVKRSSRTADVYRDPSMIMYLTWAYVKQNEVCTSRKDA